VINLPTSVARSAASFSDAELGLFRNRARADLERSGLTCFVLALIWFAATAWLRPLAIPDEGRYVGVAREMLLNGEWLVPTLNGAPFFHKPPLFYWLTAASMKVFGTHMLAVRMASILSAAALATGLHQFLRRWSDTVRARWAVIVLATTPLFFGGAQYANLDMLVAACVGTAVLLAAQASNSRDLGRPYRAPLALAFAAAALGVLAKGLIGAVLPALVLALWGLTTRRLIRTMTLFAWTPGLLLFCVIAAPWFFAMQARFPGFDHYFFVVQHFERFAAKGFNNSQPIWFYPTILIALAMPWSLWLLGMCRRSYWRQTDPGQVRALMVAWLVVVVGFFSVPNSKLIGYILPALPPLAFLVSDALHHIARSWQERAGERSGHTATFTRLRSLSACVSIVICTGAVVALHFLQPKSAQALAQRMQVARQPDEPVIFLDSYYYDVAFYADLSGPVHVIDPWLPEEVANDSWRRELVDAVRFAPDAFARTLLRPDELDSELCGAPGAWLLGPKSAPSRYAVLNSATPVDSNRNTGLWHVRRSAPGTAALLGCAAPK
jgi:4-amino-4-deoxy-L-arabinose transferase-like glycosyltransferase